MTVSLVRLCKNVNNIDSNFYKHFHWVIDVLRNTLLFLRFDVTCLKKVSKLVNLSNILQYTNTRYYYW